MAAVCVLLPIGYTISVGPILWLESRGRLQGPVLKFAVLYTAPYNWACDHMPDRMRPAVEAFEHFWAI
jgi:hypothetical protein